MFDAEKLIIGRVGEYCGNAFITKPKSWVTDNALVVSFHTDEQYKSFWCLFLNYLRLNQFAYSAAQPVITGGTISQIPIKIVPHNEQVRIVTKLTSGERQCKAEEIYLLKMHKLKQGLMQDLLTGRVRITTAD